MANPKSQSDQEEGASWPRTAINQQVQGYCSSAHAGQKLGGRGGGLSSPREELSKPKVTYSSREVRYKVPEKEEKEVLIHQAAVSKGNQTLLVTNSFPKSANHQLMQLWTGLQVPNLLNQTHSKCAPLWVPWVPWVPQVLEKEGCLSDLSAKAYQQGGAKV